MGSLVNRIGTLFLTNDVKTSYAYFEKVYQFLFVKNIELGIVIIIIAFALLIILFKKAFNSSNKDMEYRTAVKRQEEIDRESTLTSSMNNNNSSSIQYTTTKEMDYSSDLELVAVITAAIMAYMGEDAPEDGLLIRSIRKVNRRNHVNNYSD